MNETTDAIHDQLRRERQEDEEDPEAAPSFDDAEAQATYWRMRFEEERELLTKLWIAYRDLEAELDAVREEADTIAQRKAAAQLAQAEQARAAAGDEDDDPEQPGVLAIAPPDEFEVVCEAEERDVVVGRGTSFPLVFVNRGDDPVEARLTVEDAPEGWSALATEEEIELDGRSSRTIYVLVRPPAETPVGEQARIEATVATSEGTEETIELVAEVVEEPDDETTEDDEALEETDDQAIAAEPPADEEEVEDPDLVEAEVVTEEAPEEQDVEEEAAETEASQISEEEEAEAVEAEAAEPGEPAEGERSGDG